MGADVDVVGAAPGASFFFGFSGLQRLGPGLDVVGEALDEHQRPHLPGRGGVVALLVEEPAERGHGPRPRGLHLGAQGIQAGGTAGALSEDCLECADQ